MKFAPADVPYSVLHFGEEVSSCQSAGGIVRLVTQLFHLLAVNGQVHIDLLDHSHRESKELEGGNN